MSARKPKQVKELLPAFAEADARDQDAQIEVLARMDAAVRAAAEGYGDSLSDKRRRRLSLILKQFYFCGATNKEGSTMRIATLRGKLGALATSERNLKRDLELLYLWELLTASRKLRGVARKLNLRLIDELVAARRKLSPLGKKLSLVGEKLSPLDSQTVPSDLKTDTGQRQNCPPENKSALKSASKTRARSPPRCTWGELVEVVGSGKAQEALARLGEYRQAVLRQAARDGSPIPESVLESFLEVIDADA